MYRKINYEEARDLLLEKTVPVDTELAALEDSFGRILARPLIAGEDVPAFDRSPYDGYALRAEDTVHASAEHPVTLYITQEVPAGSVPEKPVLPGTAAKILTGAPIPQGADAVIMFEKTEFTDRTVTVFSPVKSGSNIVRTGEDEKKGTLLAAPGSVIDPGLAGTLAAQGIRQPEVYRKPTVALISTGSELVEPGEAVPNGKIRNTNRYTLAAALQKEGCVPLYLGTAGDDVARIADFIREGLDRTDLVLLTGGVSVGDYDLTAAAMEAVGAELLINGVALKPGMACVYGIKEGKLICGLSGNPASSLTNFYAVLRPVLRKLTGRQEIIPEMLELCLAADFRKSSKFPRLLRGKLVTLQGKQYIQLLGGQGNAVLSSTIGCDVMAVIPAGSGPVPANTPLKGFLL